MHTNLTASVTYYYTAFAFDDESFPNYSSAVYASTAAPLGKIYPPSKTKGLKGQRSADGSSFTIFMGSCHNPHEWGYCRFSGTFILYGL